MAKLPALLDLFLQKPSCAIKNTANRRAHLFDPLNKTNLPGNEAHHRHAQNGVRRNNIHIWKTGRTLPHTANTGSSQWASCNTGFSSRQCWWRLQRLLFDVSPQKSPQPRPANVEAILALNQYPDHLLLNVPTVLFGILPPGGRGRRIQDLSKSLNGKPRNRNLRHSFSSSALCRCYNFER
ncbi:hypothetical protein AVEN_18988-1 [Araneus ventricosus]|uniref:Uncharacterized protein n=1 Tax=Araneus ventricosus TaxID=182803 RepID=A0A4Y2UGV1_ARAVE|nr:hypothetical protein AVEN_18988-1 [Araneus ventricosus]